MIEGDEFRFGLGLLVVAGIYAAVLYSRRWTDRPRLLADLLDSRLHYAVAGLVLSLAATDGMRTTIGEGVDIAMVFLAGIFGLIVGGSFDWRLIKRLTKPLLWLEVGHLVLLIMTVWLLTYSFFSGVVDPENGGSGALMWAVCGLVSAGWMRQDRVDSGKNQTKGGGWLPSVNAMAGLLLAGIGLIQMRPGGFVVRQPLAFPQVIVVDGIWDEILWCALLGALVGLVVDMSTRDVRREHLYYWVGSGLLMGCGIAQVLGLEPLWVGGIAGIWLINATLRRLDLLRVLGQGQGLMRTILPAVMGWVLGGALKGGFDWIFAAWILSILVIAVPALRLGVWHGLGRFLDRSVLRRTGIEVRKLLEFDDLSPVVGLGMAALLPAEQAGALLAAVLLGQWLLHLVAVLATGKFARLTG